MAAGDIVKRTLQIIGEGTKDTFKDTFSNITQLSADADMIKKSVMNVGTTASETYKNFKNGTLTRRVSDWFYGKESELEFESGSEEFNSGMDDMNDDSSDSDVGIINADSFKRETNKQTGTLVAATHKQTEQSVINTSEIVSSFNSRSAEQIAAIHKINDTLIDIREKIKDIGEVNKKILKIQAEKDSDIGNTNPLFNSNGQLTVGSLFNAAKEAGSSSFGAEILKLIPEFKQGGPSTLVTLGLDKLLDARFAKLGDQSVKEISKQINDGIGAAIHTGLSEFMSSKLFEKFFPSLNSKGTNRDYSQYVKSDKYDREQAVFDNMTRRSITHIIPEYLKQITQSLTGKNYNIDDKGNLTDKDLKNTFNSVMDPVRYMSGMNNRSVRKIQNKNKYDSEDINNAYKILSGEFLAYYVDSDSRQLKQSELLNHPDIVLKSATLLVQIYGKSESYWTEVCMSVLGHLSNTIAGSQFCTNIHKTYAEIDRNGIEFATSGSPSAQFASTINGNDVLKHLVDDLKGDNNTDNTNTNNNSNDVNNKNKLSNNKSNKLDEFDNKIISSLGNTFTKSFETVMSIDKTTTSILNLLQRGINVNINKPAETQSGPSMPSAPTIPLGQQINQNRANKPKPVVMMDELVIPEISPAAQSMQNQITTTLSEMNSNSVITNAVGAVTGKYNNALGNIIGVAGNNGKRSGGIVQKISNPVVDKYENIRDKKLEKDIESGKGISAEDQQQAQLVMSLMQSATSDGDGNEDIQAINDEINKIKDPKLRQRLSNSIPSMLKRSSTGDSDNNTSGGGLLSFFGKGLKIALLPIKMVITKGFNLVKRGIFSAVKFLGKSLLSSGKRIFAGVKSMVSGFAGLTKSILSIPVKLFKGISSLGSGLKDLFTKNKDNGEGDTDSSDNKSSEKKDDDSSEKKTSRLSKLKEKFENTSFGQGFMQSFNELKEARNKKKPETYADEKSDELSKMINGEKDSVLSKMHGTLTNMLDSVKSILEIETDEAEEAEENTNGSNTQSSENTNENTTGNIQQTNPANASNADLESGSDVTGAPGGGAGGNAGGNGVGKKGGISGLLGNLGKIFGGFTNVLFGIGQAVLTIVAGMEGFKELVNIGQEILEKGLAPLNKAFKAIKEAIEPIVDIVTQIVETIAETIVEIAESLITVIQPLIEAIQPIMDAIFEFLDPLMDMLTTTLTLCLAPLMAYVEVYIVPALKVITDVLEATFGIVQIFMGSVMSGIGLLLTPLGKILAWLGSDDVSGTAKKLKNDGADMIIAGGKQFLHGVVSAGKDMVDMMNPVNIVNRAIDGASSVLGDEEEEPKETTSSVGTAYVPAGSAMEGTYGNGDIYNITNMYGSGNTTTNQHNYGSYMNMDKRGCGPVALADAYSRRTGRNINPLALAGNGMLDPSRGTSVGRFMSASNALGMGVTAAGVNAQSLRYASPNNPITVLGSGAGYGTASGNNHYVNVIGSDHYGGTYISNPLSGKVERRSTNAIIGGAKLGLYGSGDSSDDGIITLNEEAQSAFDELKNLVTQLKDLFAPKQTNEEKVKNVTSEVASKIAADNVGRLSEEEQQEVADKAWELFQEQNSKRDNENDAQYKARYERSKNQYLAQAMNILGYDQSSIGDLVTTATYLTSEDGYLGTVNSIMDSFGNLSTGNSGSSSSSNGYSMNGQFVSDNGVVLASSGYTPTYTDVDMTDAISGTMSKHSPIHDFFAHSTGNEVLSYDDNWFERRGGPVSKEGVGSSDTAHKGIDLWNPGHVEETGSSKVTPTTDGVVEEVGFDSSQGNYFSWKDSAGYIHKYMHLKNRPIPEVYQKVIGGSTYVGDIGNTGDSKGYHLHYQIASPNGEFVNPLTYFKFNPSFGSNGLLGGSNEEQIWWYLLDHGFTKEGAAGIMGNWKMESDNKPNNVQNSSGWEDEAYTAGLDNRTYTEDQYATDGIGYGLAQWTFGPTKRNMYKYFLNQDGKSFGDMRTQLDWFMQNIGENEFNDVRKMLTTSNDIGSTTKSMLECYERPAVLNYSDRYQWAQAYYNQFKDLIHPTTASSFDTNHAINSEDDAYKQAVIKCMQWDTNAKIGTVLDDNDIPLNIREGPNTSSKVVATVPIRNALYYIDYGNPDWYKVSTVDGVTGYAYKDYIVDSKKYDKYYAIVGDMIANGSNDTIQSNTNTTDNTISNNSNDGSYTHHGLVDRLTNSFGNLFVPFTDISDRNNTNMYELNYLIDQYNARKKGGEYKLFITDGEIDNLMSRFGNPDIASATRIKEDYLSLLKLDGSEKDYYDAFKSLYGVNPSQEHIEFFRHNNIGNGDLPPLDPSLFEDDTTMLPSGQIIYNYNIQPDYSSKKQEIYDRIMKNTYNVRAERVEQLLEDIIDRLDGKNNRPSGTNNSPTRSKASMFPNNEIPQQIIRLSQ